MKKTAIFLSFILFSVISLSAQSAIKWRCKVKMTNETEGVVTMKAIMEPGWHLYGTNLPAGGPKSTKFDLSSSTGVNFVGDITPSIAPMKVHDNVFGLDLTWWENVVTFTQKFKISGKGTPKIIGAISYMGCNDQTCLPPSTQKINILVSPFKK